MNRLKGIIISATIVVMSVCARSAETDKSRTYTFKPACKPGEEILLVQKMNMVAEGRGAKQDMAYQTELLVKALKADAQDQVKISCDVARVRVMIHTQAEGAPGTGKMEVDTDDPETFKGPMGGGMGMYKTIGFDAALADGCKLSDIKGRGEYIEKLTGNSPPDRKKEVVSRCLDPYVDVLRKQWAYLPKKPVRVNDTWRVEHKTHLMAAISGLKPRKETMTCKLASVTKTRDGLVAEISMKGNINMPGMGLSPAHADLKRTGIVTFNLDTGKFLKLHLKAEGKFSDNQTLKLTTELETRKPKKK
jgi:hypothetical protein